MNNFKLGITLEPGGWRRPGLYSDIPVPFRQVPEGEEGHPGGHPNLLKEEKKESVEEEKKEVMIRRSRWRGRGGDAGQPGGGGVHDGTFAACLLPLQLRLQVSFLQ